MSGRPLLHTVSLFLVAAALSNGAQAGDYHDMATLDCGECHVMHPASRTGGTRAVTRAVRGGHQAGDDELLQREDVGKLLRENVNDLCLSCHDDSGKAADVLGRNLGRSPHIVRQAGCLNRLGTTGFPATGHTLDALDAAPGSNPPWKPEDENGPGAGLNCINCHSHHGLGLGARAYRNLRSDSGNNPRGAGLVTYNDEHPGTNDLSRDVFVRRALAYDESAVDFNEPDPNDSAMGRFCAGCHDAFHGRPGSLEIGGGHAGEPFLRHPAAGVNIGAAGGRGSSLGLFESRANRVKVMSETGLWTPPGGDVTPTCITCHKAHGNDNPFGLIYRSGTGVLTESGDTGGDSIESLCGQCHVQGLSE